MVFDKSALKNEDFPGNFLFPQPVLICCTVFLKDKSAGKSQKK